MIPLSNGSMADHSSPNYKDLYLKAEEGRKQAEQRDKRVEERQNLEAEGRRQQKSVTKRPVSQSSYTTVMTFSPASCESRHRLAQPLAKYPSHRKRLPNSIGTLGRLPRAAAKNLQVCLPISTGRGINN